MRREIVSVTCHGGQAHAIVYGHTTAEAETLAGLLNAAIRRAAELWTPDGKRWRSESDPPHYDRKDR
jgi:hypothetical protein